MRLDPGYLVVGSCSVDDLAAGRLTIGDRQSHPVKRRRLLGVCPPKSRQVQSDRPGTRRAVGATLRAGRHNETLAGRFDVCRRTVDLSGGLGVVRLGEARFGAAGANMTAPWRSEMSRAAGEVRNRFTLVVPTERQQTRTAQAIDFG